MRARGLPDGPLGPAAPAWYTGSARAMANVRLCSICVTHTFDELVEKQRAADEAHLRVEELQHSYGPVTQPGGWSGQQADTYETARRAWRDLAREARTSVTEYAKESGKPRNEVEAEVEQAVRQSEHRS